MKARVIIICLLAAVLFLVSCNNLTAKNDNPAGAGQGESKDNSDALLDVVTSTADENESHDYSFPEPPKEITDEIKEDAAKTYLETDKTAYSADDVLRLSIVVAREDTFLGYGSYFDIQGWDEEAGEWVSALENGAEFTDDYAISTGSSSESIRLSRFPIKAYPKYRIEKQVNVDTITVTAYSNEFTVE